MIMFNANRYALYKQFFLHVSLVTYLKSWVDFIDMTRPLLNFVLFIWESDLKGGNAVISMGKKRNQSHSVTLFAIICKAYVLPKLLFIDKFASELLYSSYNCLYQGYNKIHFL